MCLEQFRGGIPKYILSIYSYYISLFYYIRTILMAARLFFFLNSFQCFVFCFFNLLRCGNNLQRNQRIWVNNLADMLLGFFFLA